MGQLYQPIHDFLNLLRYNFLEPLRQALQDSGILNHFLNFFNALLNGIFNTSDFGLTLGISAIASIITSIIAFYCFIFVIKLFKNAFGIVLNIFNEQLSIPEKRRRKRK